VEIPFADVRELTPQDFIEYLQQREPFTAIITGDNFVFGYQRSGNIQTLRSLAEQLGFISETVAGVKAAGKLISSSRVREAIGNGYCTRVTKLLGRHYASDGVVVQGEGRGRQLGFPTANIKELSNLIPGSGVYAAQIDMPDGSRHAAAINVGHLPSISSGRPLSVEAHIIDWSDDCYGQELRIEWIQRIREERKFEHLDALKTQIASDVATVRELLH
jgi:riboflavin kinase/FMN adenylyltransferase